jgi:hypothetical protein
MTVLAPDASSAHAVPMHDCVTCGEALLGRPLHTGRAAQPVEPDPPEMTVALVGTPPSDRGTASVAACLAQLARTDELTVVYGSDRTEPDPGVDPLVTALRGLLPRYTIVALYFEPHGRQRTPDVVLLEELLAIGSLPIVVTPTGDAPTIAATVCSQVRADRALRIDSREGGEARLQPVWRRRRTGVADRSAA